MFRHFNATAHAAVFERPSITIGGRTYLGVIVSADEWFALAQKLQAAVTAEDLRPLIRECTDLAFPPPRAFWKRSVSALLAELPFSTQVEAFNSFTVALAIAHTIATPGQTPKTDGNGSHG